MCNVALRESLCALQLMHLLCSIPLTTHTTVYAEPVYLSVVKKFHAFCYGFLSFRKKLLIEFVYCVSLFSNVILSLMEVNSLVNGYTYSLQHQQRSNHPRSQEPGYKATTRTAFIVFAAVLFLYILCTMVNEWCKQCALDIAILPKTTPGY